MTAWALGESDDIGHWGSAMCQGLICGREVREMRILLALKSVTIDERVESFKSLIDGANQGHPARPSKILVLLGKEVLPRVGVTVCACS